MTRRVARLLDEAGAVALTRQPSRAVARDASAPSVAAMLARVTTFAIRGLDSRRVTVEVDVRPGLPAFTIVGLGDRAVREARERVRAALLNSGFEFPQRRVTVNLAPAYVRKVGAGLRPRDRLRRSSRPPARRRPMRSADGRLRRAVARRRAAGRRAARWRSPRARRAPGSSGWWSRRENAARGGAGRGPRSCRRPPTCGPSWRSCCGEDRRASGHPGGEPDPAPRALDRARPSRRPRPAGPDPRAGPSRRRAATTS